MLFPTGKCGFLSEQMPIKKVAVLRLILQDIQRILKGY